MVPAKALGYLHGVPLIAESDRFDTSGYNDLQLAQAKIVGRAAVNELELGNRKSLFIKVAKESGGNLTGAHRARAQWRGAVFCPHQVCRYEALYIQ